MTSEALKIVDVGVFVVRDGVSKWFHVDYQFGLMSEFLHAFGPNPGVMRKLILAYNKIDDDLFMSFGAAIKAGESTVEIKNKKDDWKEYFNTLAQSVFYSFFYDFITYFIIEFATSSQFFIMITKHRNTIKLIFFCKFY